MSSNLFVPFVHRSKIGKIDSICTTCFLVVATAETPEELVKAESTHECDGLNLASLLHPDRRKDGH
jgi:hypothetical protein